MAEAPAGSERQCGPERQSSAVEDIFKCTICHNEMSNSSITPCGHRFCTSCIKQWIKRRPNCPACRKDITSQSLIEDRTFDDVIRTFKERAVPTGSNVSTGNQGQQQQQQGQNVGNSTEEMGNIIKNGMLQDMRKLTDSLLAMKDQQINRLEALKLEHTNTIRQLKDEKSALQRQLGDELPTLTERSSQLQQTVDREREQNQQLRDKIQGLEANMTQYRTSIRQTADKNKVLEDQLRQNTQELKTTRTSLDTTKKENTHLKMQLQSCKDELSFQNTQLEKSELTSAQMKELVDSVFQQKQIFDAELETTRQKCLQLDQQVKQYQMFESMYQHTAQELNRLSTDVLPNRDAMIAQLQDTNSDLIKETASLHQNNIPMDQHVSILQTQLYEAIQQLHCYSEEEYGAKITQLEKVNALLKKQLDEKETELQNREDVGDELKCATRTYKSLIKENSDLKDKVKEQETQIKRLTQDISYSKARTNAQQIFFPKCD